MEEAVITLVGGFVAIGIILSLALALSIVIKGFRGGGKKARGQDTEETRLIQEIYHGLSKMEDRVEALETLLLDDDRKRRKDFDKELHNG